jgi:hypothetical protein
MFQQYPFVLLRSIGRKNAKIIWPHVGSVAEGNNSPESFLYQLDFENNFNLDSLPPQALGHFDQK